MSSQHNRSDSPSEAFTLRAVAHPLRIELLNLLRRDGPLTAGRCAEMLGVVPKICSYHLNLLGKYGLIEETGEGKGRARPWRLRATGVNYVHRPGEDRVVMSAADQLARTILARDVRLVESFIEQRHLLRESWRNVAIMSSNPLRLTSKQLQALRADLAKVMDRYEQLSQTADDTAHPVHVALYAIPVELADLLDEDTAT